MDPTTNFLTAPTPSTRGNDGLAGSGTGDISPSGAQFAGVLNGQMLKLERQALAPSASESVDLQVLRLGNKLNVITTDAPLPDLASLADFARAQGLGESAVQALFGVSGMGSPALKGLASPELADTGSPQAAMALAQASSKDLLQIGASPEAIGAIAGQNWLNLRAQNAAAAAISISAESLARQAADLQSAATAASAPQLAVTAVSATGLDALQASTVPPVDAPLAINPLLEAQAAPIAPLATSSALSALLAGQRADPASAKTAAERGPLAVRPHLQADQDAAAVLAAAVQAGLGLVPLQQTADLDASRVTVTSLSIEKPTSAGEVDVVETGALALAAAKALIPTNAPLRTSGVEAELRLPEQTAGDLQIRLVPPDQAITQRLAQMAGKSKSINWSALLAGQKVSDTLAGLAQSPSPALDDAQAKLVAQMQANGQLPASDDPARNALLAKLQVQAASGGTSPAGLGLAPGTQAPNLAPNTQPLTGAALAASQNAAQATVTGNEKLLASQSALAVQAAGSAPTLTPARTSSLWESVRIEVPSGLLLEALEEHQAQESDAEPTLPGGAGAESRPSVNLAPSQGAEKAQAATPQALAEQRAAQYQQVADQLGEAMARRLMAQIERGQWKMQLRMQPAALGRIDVELDMHAKGLDATFTSDNAVTRELMAQGSARLRDTLTQTGTTVASVVVNGDSGRQSGGNSTPGQKFKSGQNADNKKAAAQAQVQTAAPAPAAQGDGLNLLA